MNYGELKRLQHRQMSSTLCTLIHLCQQRFIRAADLVGVRSEAIEGLRHAYKSGVDVQPLIPTWNRLCQRYNVEVYDRQLHLFEDRTSQVEHEWNAFAFEWVCSHLPGNNDVCRNVLRAVKWLPARDHKAAADAVQQYVSECQLPGRTPPSIPE